jgi:lipopolysaccharide transport system permease protein
MEKFSILPSEMARGVWRNRALIGALVKREIVGRYRGSVMGILWSFLIPIFMLSVYTLVFSVIFKARWGTGGDSKTEFALVLFAGLLVYNFFAECINRSPLLIINNINYVKKVIFPLEVLPWVSMGAALFHALISLSVWIAAYALLFGVPHLTVLLIPLVFLPLILFVMGFSWLLAASGVYLRDISQLIGIITTTLMFLSPIFYPATAIPEQYRSLLFMNPLTPVIELARSVLFFGHGIDWGVYSICMGVSVVVCWLGFAWFQKTRKGFADVL